MKQRWLTPLAGAALSAALLLAGTAAQAQRDLSVVSWGGAYQDGQKEVFFKPFNTINICANFDRFFQFFSRPSLEL